jgi:hypothetical protein
MKKILLIVLMGLSINAFAQEATVVKSKLNEIKVNAPYLLAGYPEVSYERIIDDESSVGISIGFSADEVFNYDFTAIPYYRFYFGKKQAAGFFIEGNGIVFSGKNESVIYDDITNNYNSNNSSHLGMGLGMAIGGKFLNKNGWVGELFAGGGRNFINEDKISNAYPRFGLSIGKRF